MNTTTAIYENGTLKLKGRLPLRNHELVIVRVDRKPDPIEGTRGIIRVSRRFARELTTPHKYSILDR
jgi:predicted DNA-binding antitoxin AbrB/MazE fold protein